MQTEGIRLPQGQKLGSSNSPRTLVNNSRSRYYMEPDGIIFFRTKRSLDFKVVVEVGVSQTHDSLLEKARKWIFGKKCKVVLLLAFNEETRYSAPQKCIRLKSHQLEERVEQMRLYCESQDHSQFGPLVFQGHTWLDKLCEGFIEVVRKNPDSDEADAVLRMKYVLIEDGRDNSSSIPQSVGDIRLGELIPRESIGFYAAVNVVVDFFSSDDFMDIVRCAMIDTAVDRFENATEIIA
ncbi:hypothetical protein V1507DRAFT_382510 [Lipomyces tetrasporus]